MARQRNLFGLSREAIVERVRELGVADYRGRQVYRWLYRRSAREFSAMTDLSRALRDELARRYTIRHPRLDRAQQSRDGTVKLQFELDDGLQVESVYIPDPPRHTVCLSTQVGCPLGCTFCFSGTVPLRRNLTPAEIVGQLRGVRGQIEPPLERLNVVPIPGS